MGGGCCQNADRNEKARKRQEGWRWRTSKAFNCVAHLLSFLIAIQLEEEYRRFLAVTLQQQQKQEQFDNTHTHTHTEAEQQKPNKNLREKMKKSERQERKFTLDKKSESQKERMLH